MTSVGFNAENTPTSSLETELFKFPRRRDFENGIAAEFLKYMCRINLVQ